MREQTVAMYCLLDDFSNAARPGWARPAEKSRHLSDAEILTTALVAARFFGGNWCQAQHYMTQHWGMNKLDKSGFGRHLHRLQEALLVLFVAFGQRLKDLDTSTHYVIDWFPVAVCHKMCVKQLESASGAASCSPATLTAGVAPRKCCWFYGFRVQLVCTAQGPQLPEGRVRYADAGYTDYTYEDLLTEASGCQLLVARKHNSKRPHDPARAHPIQQYRKNIETQFRVLTGRFPKKIQAVTAEEFVLELILFVFVHALAQSED